MSQRRLRRGNWSVQELERLRQLLPQRGVEQTAALLRRTPESVRRKALEILRMPRRHGAWTDSDDWSLRLAWGALEPALLGPLLGRSVIEVRRRATELRRSLRQGAWTRVERQLLKKLYGTRHDKDLEVCLMRPQQQIAAEAARLCLAKDKRFAAAGGSAKPAGPEAPGRGSMPRWTSDQVARLRELYPHHDNLTVARALGRSVTSVANKAHQLGIRKSRALLKDIGRSNIACRYQVDGDGREQQAPVASPLPPHEGAAADGS